MQMDQVKEIMKEAGSGFLATTDGERASVRPMGGWAWVGDELWCAAGMDSAKVADIKKRPQVEYCFTDSQMRHIRISGECRVSTDNSDKARLLELVPGIAQHVQGPEDPNYGVLRLTSPRIRAADETGTGYQEVTP